MASVNKVIIVGNLGRDPDVRYTPSGDAVANIAVATSYKAKDRNTGEQNEVTEWHRIAFFGRLAEIVGQYMKKGSSIYVEGRLQTHKYTDKDGVERYATDIIAESMQMLGSAGNNHAGQHVGNDSGRAVSDDVPSCPSPIAATAAAAPAGKRGSSKAAAKAAKSPAAPGSNNDVPF